MPTTRMTPLIVYIWKVTESFKKYIVPTQTIDQSLCQIKFVAGC